MKRCVILLSLGLLSSAAQAQMPSGWQPFGAGPVAPTRPTTAVVTPTIVAALPEGRLNGETVYLLNGNWVALLSAGEGNFTARKITSSRGQLVEPQPLGGAGTVRTEAGAVALSAGNVIKYREAGVP
jgi:hypothetical protein